MSSEDNGREQLYLIHADNNVIRRNQATGGTQGLEMRFSSGNAFSYNVWAGSPLQYLENDNNDNTFFYERFEGRVAVGDASTGNRFELSSFSNPTGNCLTVAVPNTAYVFKSFFGPCSWDVVGNALVTLDRSVNTLAKVSKAVTVRFPGCTADFDLDGSVTTADRPTILAAMGSVIGGPGWEPEADLDHDGDVDAADLAIFDAQSGPCAADLAVTALSDPPAVAVPGSADLGHGHRPESERVRRGQLAHPVLPLRSTRRRTRATSSSAAGRCRPWRPTASPRPRCR